MSAKGMSAKKTGHIAPFDFTRLLDGELSFSERETLWLHVKSCESCTQALASVRTSLDRLLDVIQLDAPVAQDDASSRSRLSANLIAVEAESGRIGRHRGLLRGSRLANYAALLLMAVALAGIVSYRHARRVEVDALLLPKKSLTPGAVRNVALTELCAVVEDDDLDPVVSVPVQNAVFSEYGIPPEQLKANFQMDYLINPQLGGVNDVRNLWPQPYSSEWNATAKDTLERHLHQMVCEHKIELADAQREIADNWIDAYKKYFHTSKPI